MSSLSRLVMIIFQIKQGIFSVIFIFTGISVPRQDLYSKFKEVVEGTSNLTYHLAHVHHILFSQY